MNSFTNVGVIRTTAAPELAHGEVYGSLKVLEKLRSGRYRVGCTCGYAKDSYRAKALMRAWGVRECRRCRSASTFNPDAAPTNS